MADFSKDFTQGESYNVKYPGFVIWFVSLMFFGFTEHHDSPFAFLLDMGTLNIYQNEPSAYLQHESSRR